MTAHCDPGGMPRGHLHYNCKSVPGKEVKNRDGCLAHAVHIEHRLYSWTWQEHQWTDWTQQSRLISCEMWSHKWNPSSNCCKTEKQTKITKSRKDPVRMASTPRHFHYDKRGCQGRWDTMSNHQAGKQSHSPKHSCRLQWQTFCSSTPPNACNFIGQSARQDLSAIPWGNNLTGSGGGGGATNTWKESVQYMGHWWGTGPAGYYICRGVAKIRWNDSQLTNNHLIAMSTMSVINQLNVWDSPKKGNWGFKSCARTLQRTM